ncbi:hypothetical protein E5676_scaffold21G003810 [Cucumis melo var. makuwa]|uniref:Uncharacterized protein n=2 Tax=Cucumis melo TaxID=3656 RepID=A0A5D3CX93_CUCMM|nr:hypothetical protein E6C27_scaffold74G002030 [Cucumis melo var. makuwa]TYK16561.1 hypothetical protein E5676_scaffold21G003810 [Cucumis melo var. makuwa]
MAKLTLTFILFFVLISSSLARDLKNLPEHAEALPFSVIESAEDSDSKASILLPSQKLSESEFPKSIPETDQVRTQSNPTEITTLDTIDTVADPVVMITFRPINRQFGRRSVPLMFRRGRRGCHHLRSLKPWRSIDRVEGISYGNDMIVPEERSSPNSGSNREIAIPLKLSGFRHVGPWEGSYIGDWKEDKKDLHHHHFHHQHHEGEEDHEHKETSGLLRKFRKFLKYLEL